MTEQGRGPSTMTRNLRTKYPEFGQGGLSADDPVRHPVDDTTPRVNLRDAIAAHIERAARETGTYHGNPTATPGGTGYCIPAAVATQIVDKYLLEFLGEGDRAP